jgi:RNA polymerase sigma-70 factor (ECF subfamily)
MLAESKDEAFRTQLEPYRRPITLHAYRMLGSIQDAEEVAQESLVRGWEHLEELRSSGAAKAWLYKIATNACLDRLKARRRRALPPQVAPAADPGQAPGAPAHEGLWIEPAPDAWLDVPGDPDQRPDARAMRHESIALAFITALQLLPPKQRAALLLVDVLGLRPRETADLLETTEVSVNSLLQRARKSVETRTVEPQLPKGTDEAALLGRLIDTWERGDLNALTGLLAKDAVFSMPPHAEWYAGRAAIRQFFERFLVAEPQRFRLLPVGANGSPAVGVYAAPLQGGAFEPVAITLFTIREGLVSEIIKFTMPQLFPLFGLPGRLSDKDAQRTAAHGRPASVT